MIAGRAEEVGRTQARIAGGTLEKALLLALLLAGLLLALVNLPYAPRTWFDEGSHLHVPKALVQLGVYADVSSEGFRYHGPTVGVGPTVMLPIALMFKLFGIGLTQGRLVVVLYLLLGLAAIYTLGRRLHGPRVGLLALALLLASRTFSYEGAIEYGRQALGEMPGTAFVLLGALAWLMALRQPSWRWSILAGLGFGLALVTKNQFTLIIPPALFLAGLLDWRYYRAGSWRLRLVPLIITCFCAGLWTLAQFQFLGPGSFLENFREEASAAGGSVVVFDLRATLRAGYYLLRPDLYGGLLIPSLLYGLWRARRRDAQGLAEALVSLIVGLWLSWYVISLGWPRYAFPAVALGALLVARLLNDLIGWLWQAGAAHRKAAVAVGLYAGLAILVPLALSARVVLSPDDSAQRFAAYMDANVPFGTVVETWEPELGFLTDHRYHYPPENLLDDAIQRQWMGGSGPLYDGLQDAPLYVVVGPFGNYTGVYPTETLARDYALRQEIGPYVLFERKQ